MSLSNFELDITSRVVGRDAGADASSGLVWQPTLTLWRPGENTPTLCDSPAVEIDGPTASRSPVHPAQSRSPAASGRTTPEANPVQVWARTHSKDQVKSDRQRLWRGNLSPARTFWCYALFFSIGAEILTRPPWEEWASSGVLVAVVFAVLIALQLGSGLAYLRAIWRKTLLDSIEGGSALCGGLTRGASLVIFIAGVQLALLTGTPRLVQLSNIAAGVVPTGHYQLKLVRGGTELAIDGAMGIGLSDQVAQLLDRNPLVQSLQLNSLGGSAYESRKLRDLIAQRKLATSTSQGCHGECTLAYLAGEPRRIGDQANLRFYRSAQPGMPEWALWRDYERDRRDWLARGVPLAFADQALTARDTEGWQPSRSELIAAHIVSPSLGSLDTKDRPGSPNGLIRLEHELHRATFFTLLKEQEPETYRKIVGEIHAGLLSSGNAENFQLRIYPIAKAAAYERLSRAEDTLLLEYAELILEQISLLYSESAEVCNRYFGMDLSGSALDAAKYFPEEILTSENAVMADVLQSSAGGKYHPPARQTIQARWSTIMALIGKRYGAKAVLFFESRPANRDPGQTCHVLYEFYKEATRLPAREAGPLLRYHFAQLQARSLPQGPSAHPAKQVTSVSAAAATRRLAH